MSAQRPTIKFRAEIFKEGDAFVAVSPELDVSSFGPTVDAAQDSLLEAVAAFVEECQRMGTLAEVLEEAGFHQDGDDELWVHREPAHVDVLVA